MTDPFDQDRLIYEIQKMLGCAVKQIQKAESETEPAMTIQVSVLGMRVLGDIIKELQGNKSVE